MIWLVGAGCLALGVIIGVAFASQFATSPSRVRELENQIRTLEDKHNRYRDEVSDHFSTTAELVQQMTESYKEVYQHLALGAQELCSGEVAGKLLPAATDPVFERSNGTDLSLAPPKDYAAKQNPQQKGALSEDFGLNKSRLRGDDDLSY